MKSQVKYLIFLMFVITACKKNRTCTCTVTTSGLTSTRTQTDGIPPLINATDTTISIPLNTSNTNATTFSNVTKAQAKNNCLDRTENVNESTSNGVPGLVTITITNSGTRIYVCDLD